MNNEKKELTLLKTNKDNFYLLIKNEATLSKVPLILSGIVVFGFFLFFLLGLIDFLLDTFTSKGGFITQYDGDKVTRSTFIDVLILFLCFVFVLGVSLVFISETEIEMNPDYLVVYYRTFLLRIKRIKVETRRLVKANFFYSINRNGETAYLFLKTDKFRKKIQLYNSETKIPSSLKQTLRTAEEKMKEILRKSLAREVSRA